MNDKRNNWVWVNVKIHLIVFFINKRGEDMKMLQRFVNIKCLDIFHLEVNKLIQGIKLNE